MMLMKDIGTVAISHSAIRCSHRERGIPFTHNEAAVTSGQLKQPPLDTLSTCFLKKHCHDKDKTYVCSVVSCCCACQYCWNQAIATTFSSSTIHPFDHRLVLAVVLVENNLSRTTCQEQLVENNLLRTTCREQGQLPKNSSKLETSLNFLNCHSDLMENKGVDTTFSHTQQLKQPLCKNSLPTFQSGILVEMT